MSTLIFKEKVMQLKIDFLGIAAKVVSLFVSAVFEGSSVRAVLPIFVGGITPLFL